MPSIPPLLHSPLTLTMVVLTTLGTASCGEELASSPATGCTEVRADVNYLNTTSEMFTASQPLNSLDGNVRSFFWDYSIDNLCVAAPEANNRAKFDVNVNTSAPASLAMVGRVYHAAGFQPYAGNLVSQSVAGGAEYKVTVGDIGLQQGSADGIRSNIISELVVSFTTTGSLSADLALAKTFLQNITMEVDYQYIKP